MEQIKIKNIEEKSTKKGVVFWVITDEEGEKYTAWDKTLVDTMKKNQGKIINAEIKESGEFRNIRDVQELEEKVESKKEDREESEEREKESYKERTERDKDIIAQTIIKCASEIYKEKGGNKTEFVELAKMVQTGLSYVRGKL